MHLAPGPPFIMHEAVIGELNPKISQIASNPTFSSRCTAPSLNILLEYRMNIEVPDDSLTGLFAKH